MSELLELIENLKLGKTCMEKLLNKDFTTVLDIGCGTGVHTRIFQLLRKRVTSIDRGSYPFKRNKLDHIIEKDYLKYKFKDRFDCIWCSHVIEHQKHPGEFTDKLYKDLKAGGLLALVFPIQIDGRVAGGHISNFTLGHIIYRLILSGFNCRNLQAYREEEEYGLILKKKSVPKRVLKSLDLDRKDITKIENYIPPIMKGDDGMSLRQHFPNEHNKLKW